jgi:UDP-N-acetyl-D-mannosaminuronic acid transferase (WecB/TagA/CpsF family)
MRMRILGLDFFNGSVAGAVDCALEQRGLIVAPSGTCFRRLQRDEVYRRAMTSADLILPDSGLMVLLWRLFRGERIERISGLAYLKDLLGRSAFRKDRSILWVMPNDEAKEQTLAWLHLHGFLTTGDDFHVAPIYSKSGISCSGGLRPSSSSPVEDPILLARVQARRPNHIVIALSGGVQEKLGAYLRAQYPHHPAIHCIGAALGFITGYQVAIPDWADRLYLGWLVRLLSNPRKFLPRALSALALPWLIARYGERLPPLKN